MILVLGGTGHVGREVANALLRRNQTVMVVGHDPSKGDEWLQKGASFAAIDIRDTEGLRKVLSQGKRAFLLNPPAPPSTDVDVLERETIASIVAALSGTTLEKVVIQSTYGARFDDHCGDLGSLYEFERKMELQPIPASIMRAAFLFSNWDPFVNSAFREGSITSMFPADLKIPMVSPIDLGEAAADLLLSEVPENITHVEGPQTYSSQDVADAFSVATGRKVGLSVIPQDQWIPAYKKLGFSDAAATSYECRTAATVNGQIEVPPTPRRGSTRLLDHIQQSCAQRREW
jgi:uncharacterized protein YbjT (DUF2867 family)